MNTPQPVRLPPTSPLLPSVLTLIQDAFAYMAPRINPPSSMRHLTVQSIRDHCEIGEIWVIGDRPDACIFLRPKSDCLYMGRLAVHEDMRGKGLAKALIQLAEQRAIALGFSALELETRIELTENHRAFERMGFVKIADGTHKGFDRPTYIIMRKPITPPMPSTASPHPDQSL
ncbi:GNAT family N-acetyltransferase [Maritalea mediterranea]|uniref:GNAT family N-acetyltransferase n=1 Tax=Maritalea mediterranea TaxID=2909667 RepID=A0ABS9EA29_9HYPH|nr:GNAT family N-acetyltransferase [Maritalea mediterranea]MCF4099725.1 GNAT family N-acetyltransferase [Maritalea mediterranea]